MQRGKGASKCGWGALVQVALYDSEKEFLLIIGIEKFGGLGTRQIDNVERDKDDKEGGHGETEENAVKMRNSNRT